MHSESARNRGGLVECVLRERRECNESEKVLFEMVMA